MATDPNSASAAYLAMSEQMKVQGGVQYGSTSSSTGSRSSAIQYLQALQKAKSQREGQAQETMTEERGRLRVISNTNRGFRDLDPDIYNILNTMASDALGNPRGAKEGWLRRVGGIVNQLTPADKEERTAAVYAIAWQEATDAAIQTSLDGNEADAQHHQEAADALRERSGQDASPVDYVNRKWPIYTESEIDEMARSAAMGSTASLDADIAEAKKMAGVGGGSIGGDASSSALTWYMSPYMPARFRDVSRRQVRAGRRADLAEKKLREAVAERKLREERAKHQGTALGHVAEAVVPTVAPAPEPAVGELPVAPAPEPLADAAPPTDRPPADDRNYATLEEAEAIAALPLTRGPSVDIPPSDTDLSGIEAPDEALVAERERLDAILAEGGSAMTQKEREMLHPKLRGDPSLARQKEKAELWRLREEAGLPGASLAIPRPEGAADIGGDETLDVEGLDSPMPANVRKEDPDFEPDVNRLVEAHGIDPELAAKIVEVAINIGARPDDLADIISFESGFNPTARPIDRETGERLSSAVGLLQIIDSSAKDLGLTTDDIISMSAIEQMDVVEQYFKLPQKSNIGGKKDGVPADLSKMENLAMAVFQPSAIGKPDTDFGDEIAAKNGGIRTPGQYVDFVRRKARRGRPPVEQAAPATAGTPAPLMGRKGAQEPEDAFWAMMEKEERERRAAQPPVPPGGRAGDPTIYETRADLYAANPDLPPPTRGTTIPPTPFYDAAALTGQGGAQMLEDAFARTVETVPPTPFYDAVGLVGQEAEKAALTDDEILANGISQLGIKVEQKTPAFAKGQYDRIHAATGAPPSREMTNQAYMDVLKSMGAGSREDAQTTMLQVLSDRDSAKVELQDVIGKLQNRPKMKSFASGIKRINIDPSSPGAEDLPRMGMGEPDMRRLSERREELTHKVNFLKGLADFVVDPEFIKQTDEDLLKDAIFNGR